ncbi:hypothetical protein DFR70_102324 [Nocardia tenerifensis]|uniref:Uncharacterized protein n=1 Tax=Nocardia tenerifensis TaxID=228006 RepID=A0A318KBP0_9NOCA|nr:hypothetical protein [Nocardia tenerifensis]PXX68640.1 hypothetical protein DFR70_102324 [Nocardia tenerifensis]
MTTDTDQLYIRARAFLSELFYANYEGSVAFLRRRGAQHADAEDITWHTYQVMLEKLADARDELHELRRREPDAQSESRSRELVEHLTTRPGRGLLFEAVKHRHISIARSVRPIPVAEPAPNEPVPFEAAVASDHTSGSVIDSVDDRVGTITDEMYGVDPADIVITGYASAQRHSALRTLIRVLVERGRLTRDGVDLIDQIYLFTEADDELEEPPIPDATSIRREREARVRARHRRDPNRGRITKVAAKIGTSTTTVSRRNSTLLTILRQAIYFAGILAAPGTLHDPHTIHAVLDGYEKFCGTADSTTIELLGSAAGAVRTTEATGSRVDIDRFLAASKSPVPAGDIAERRAAEIARVHAEETRFAISIENRHPNCVAVCGPHNPDRTRTWEQ